jgi:mannitol/fructose-specific phosphotransferase system IIA component
MAGNFNKVIVKEGSISFKMVKGMLKRERDIQISLGKENIDPLKLANFRIDGLL